jgi:hypothetical protein
MSATSYATYPASFVSHGRRMICPVFYLTVAIFYILALATRSVPGTCRSAWSPCVIDRRDIDFL